MKAIKLILFPFVIFTLMVFATGCTKQKTASEVPSIEFRELLNFENDSLAFKIHFIDGDGDIGLNEDDTEEPYNDIYQPGDPLFVFTSFPDQILERDSFNINGFTISMRYFAFEDGQWTEPEIRPFSLFNIDNLTPDGEPRYLEGDISYGLNLVDIGSPNAWVKDTMKFEILLKDRALNSSNIVETPVIVIQ